MEKEQSIIEPVKQWYNPRFFKTKFLLLCASLCFVFFVIWAEQLIPDLTALPGVWKSETGQVMAISGKRDSVSNLNYTLYDGNLVFEGHTLAKQENAVFTKLENTNLFVEFGDAQFMMLSDTELFYLGTTFYKERFYFQNHYDFEGVGAPVGEPLHVERVVDIIKRWMLSSLAIVAIYWLLQSMFPLFSVSILIPKSIRQKWKSWRQKKEEQDKKTAPKSEKPVSQGKFQLFLRRLLAIGAKIWYFCVGCFGILLVIGGIYGVAGAFIPGLIVDSDDLPGLWKTNDGTVLAISTIHDDRGRGTTQYDWEIVRDGEMLLDWGDVYSDDSEEGYEAVIRLGDGKTTEHVFYMKDADQMMFDGEAYHKIETEETSYNFGNTIARVGFDDQTAPQVGSWISFLIIIGVMIWAVYISRKLNNTNQKANLTVKQIKHLKKGIRRG